MFEKDENGNWPNVVYVKDGEERPARIVCDDRSEAVGTGYNIVALIKLCNTGHEIVGYFNQKGEGLLPSGELKVKPRTIYVVRWIVTYTYNGDKVHEVSTDTYLRAKGYRQRFEKHPSYGANKITIAKVEYEIEEGDTSCVD